MMQKASRGKYCKVKYAVTAIKAMALVKLAKPDWSNACLVLKTHISGLFALRTMIKLGNTVDPTLYY